MPFDWHQFHLDEISSPAVVDSRRRLRIFLGGFVLALFVVFARAVQLELSEGAAFRAEAAKPLRRETSPPGVRGRILARDGTVLACDKEVLAVAVHYRHLQQPPDAAWLRRTVRKRLSASERKDPRRVAEEEARVRAELADQARQLAAICGVSAEEWQRRAGRIQSRVERIAAAANRRAADDAAPAAPPKPPPKSLFGRVGRMLAEAFETPPEDLSATPIIVAEQLDYHVMAEPISLDVVAKIEGHPQAYPGVKIVHRSRRTYPNGPVAACLLGHLGPVDAEQISSGDDDRPDDYRPDDLVGRMGVERQYESLLRGRRGVAVELTDHSGQILSSELTREPGIGRDLVLSIDLPLQRAAESLLDDALRRRRLAEPESSPAGGAIVVLDLRDGGLLVAASAPRFDPNVFATGDSAERAALLDRPDDPLFDRAVRMALPPGGIFKTIAAAALQETSAVKPDEPFFCQGYLHQPDRMRCAIYRRQGVGHDDVTLADALAQNCDVYFFHHAGQLGSWPLIDWAGRFGFGRPTGVDLPGEAVGVLPEVEPTRAAAALDSDESAPVDGDAMLLAIGQGELTATPLQVARLMAAVANGGQLISPRVASRLGMPQGAAGDGLGAEPDDPIAARPPQPVAGLHGETLAAIREGLHRAVADPRGAAHDTVALDSVAIAGIPGTAASAGGDHAWFAGYVPAENPKYALVVALEHAGEGATAAGPVAQRLVRRMQQLGMF